MDDVAEPLLWQLLPFLLLWKMDETLRISSYKGFDFLYTERLILRNREVLDVICQDDFPLTTTEILKKTKRRLNIKVSTY